MATMQWWEDEGSNRENSVSKLVNMLVQVKVQTVFLRPRFFDFGGNVPTGLRLWRHFAC
jgi:hypothetical protein